jgi:hypothetical protein
MGGDVDHSERGSDEGTAPATLRSVAEMTCMGETNAGTRSTRWFARASTHQHPNLMLLCDASHKRPDTSLVRLCFVPVAGRA